MSEDDSAQGRSAIAEHAIQWPNIIEANGGPLAEQWNIDSWPSIYILDREGKIRARHFSKNPNAEEIRRRVDRLLERPREVGQNSNPDGHLVERVSPIARDLNPHD